MAETIPEGAPSIPHHIPGDLLPIPILEQTLSVAELDKLHRVAALVPELVCSLPQKPTHPIIETAEFLGRVTNLNRHGRCWGYDVF